MADMTMIWNAILTMAIGGFMWWIRSTSASISKVKEEVSETREKMALVYATKEDVKDDMTQLMQRFDRLESKIDDMIRRQANNN
jgi:chaperonin cofactor prefoldin